MGRMSASEYYNDNLKRLLREEVGQSAPPEQISRGGAVYTDPRRESTARQGNYRPVRTTYQADDRYCRDVDRAARPQVPVYGSESYRIGERDERRSKIDGVYGRRQTDVQPYDRTPQPQPSPQPQPPREAGYRPVRQPNRSPTVQPRPQPVQQRGIARDQSPAPIAGVPRNYEGGQAVQYGQYGSAAPRQTQAVRQPSRQDQAQAQAQRLAQIPAAQAGAARPRTAQASPRPQAPQAAMPQTSPQRTAPRPRPERMQTNPGGGMSYDARYGGEIKPTSAGGAAQQNPGANNGRGDKSTDKKQTRKEAKKERDRLDPEVEAEIRENRRLYNEYVANERMTMDRAERDRRRMEEYYAARSGKLARKLRELFILTAAFAVTLGLICVIVYKFLFVVSEVKVYGESVVDHESIIAASGVEQGDNLYSFGASAVSSAVTLRYPIIKSVTVKRTIPNKVAFTVTDDEPVFYSDIYGEYRMLSADLRVMGVRDEGREGLIKLKLPPLAYAVDGREVQYADGKQNRYVMDIIGVMLSSPLADRMTMIDLTHSYDVKMVCDGKYLLSFGESEEMDIKMKIAAAVLEDELFSGGNKATVDLSNTSQTSVIIDNQLVLD